MFACRGLVKTCREHIHVMKTVRTQSQEHCLSKEFAANWYVHI